MYRSPDERLCSRRSFGETRRTDLPLPARIEFRIVLRAHQVSSSAGIGGDRQEVRQQTRTSAGDALVEASAEDRASNPLSIYRQIESGAGLLSRSPQATH